MSCFVTDSEQVEPKRLFSWMRLRWKSGEKFMFSLSSKLSTRSLPRTLFVDRGWTIDITNNVTHLFLQVNHPDHLREACEVARKVVCSQDASIHRRLLERKGFERGRKNLFQETGIHRCRKINEVVTKP